MKTEDKRTIAKIWCLVTTILLVTALWPPIITKSGQALNEPFALLGCGMAVVAYYMYSKYGAIK